MKKNPGRKEKRRFIRSVKRGIGKAKAWAIHTYHLNPEQAKEWKPLIRKDGATQS
jgi:hypothetical protein